jgi:hypothetical protein
LHKRLTSCGGLNSNSPPEESLEQWAQRVAAEQPEQTTEQFSGVDPEVQAALSNPKVLSLLQNHEAQLNQQVATYAAQYQQAETAFASALQQNAALSVGAILAIPELQGIHPSQIPTAIQIIQRQNPQRAEQIATQINRAQQVVQQAQAMQAAEQQRQVQQYQAQWAQFTKDETAKFERAMPEMADPAHAHRVGKDALQTLRNVGFSDEDISRAWKGEASISLMDHRAQILLARAAMYDRAIAGLPAARSNPIPHVQSPSTRNEAYFAEAAPRMPTTFKNAKEAAEFITQRRGSRR